MVVRSKSNEPFRVLELCAGYGGFSLAFKLAGIESRTVCYVEREVFAASVLVARMEDKVLDEAPIWDCIETFDGKPWGGKVDIITAGFPCQPWSKAGLQKGVDDPRWLWPQIFRIVCEVGPRFVFLENVPALNGRDGGGLSFILADFAKIGWDAEWGLLSAAEVGAPHRRERFWLLAHCNSEGLFEVGRESGKGGNPRDNFDRCGSTVVADTDGARPERPGRTTVAAQKEQSHAPGRGLPAWPPLRDDADGWADYIAQGGPEPAVRRGPDGRPAWLADALHLGGNGIVPRVAAEAFAELAVRLEVGVKLSSGLNSEEI